MTRAVDEAMREKKHASPSADSRDYVLVTKYHPEADGLRMRRRSSRASSATRTVGLQSWRQPIATKERSKAGND
jgi:hypothetical protein